MFNREQFIKYIHDQSLNEALNLLDALKDNNELKKMDPKTGRTLLHEIAQSELFDEALKAGNENANKILDHLMSISNFLLRDKSLGCTAFLMAVKNDHRAIASTLFNYFIKNNNGRLFELFISADNDKRTALHHAIINCNHVLINDLLKQDDHTQTLYFKCDKSGLYSLALAFDQYQKNPTALTLSIGNQLYFSLPQGNWRTKAVEENVYMGWGILSTPLWRYALRYCAKRDENKKIVAIDLNLVDLINQVCRDGLTVMGFNVTWELIYEYSESYSDTPGEMLREAVKNLGVNLPGRTLGQADVNGTLARNREFMQRAKLESGSYRLSKMTKDPGLPYNISTLNYDTNHIVLFKSDLYYLPKGLSQRCIEIKRHELSEKDTKYYDNLMGIMKDIPEKGRYATEGELKNIIAIVPLVPTNSALEVPMSTIPVSSNRGVGMTLFSRSGFSSGVSRDVAPATTSTKPSQL